MRTILTLVFVLCTSVVLAGGPMGMPPNTIRATPSFRGGYNFYDSRGFVGRSEPNMFNGYNTYDCSNRLMQRTMRNSTGSYQVQQFHSYPYAPYSSYRSYRW